MPKARLDGRRVTRCSNMPGYKKKIENGAYLNGQTEFYDREAALCQEVTKWIDSKRYKIVDLLLSPQGMARGYLSKWVEWAYKNGMPTLPAPSEYANEEERDQKLRANFTALVDHVCAAKKGVTGLLLTLKGCDWPRKGNGVCPTRRAQRRGGPRHAHLASAGRCVRGCHGYRSHVLR